MPEDAIQTLWSLDGEKSNLGLGHDMPDFSVIRVGGFLERCGFRLVENHRCSFGDCSFKKEVLRGSTKADGTGAVYKFTWCRDDEEEFWKSVESREIEVDMHQWVPTAEEQNCDIFGLSGETQGEIGRLMREQKE